MKKTVTRIAIVLLIAAVAVAAWFFGYYHRKSMDNIPSKPIMLEYLNEEGEEYAAEKIQGYTREAIQYIWGEPSIVLEDGSDLWEVEEQEGAYLLVTYNEKEKAETVRWASVFAAEVKELYDGSCLVEADPESWVRRSSDVFSIGLSSLVSDQELQVGEQVEIIFSGGIQESDPAGLDRVHRVRIME